MAAVAAALAILMTVPAGWGEAKGCTSGKCRFDHAASACLTRAAYDELADELLYVHRTRDTSRIRRLYLGGLCKRFPAGTRVNVVSSGVLTVKVRFVYRTGEPDRWMSAEALRKVR